MGYYTCYNMDVQGFKNEAELKALTEKLQKKEILGYALMHDYRLDRDNHTASFDGYDAVKWYDHDTDMLEISREFPDMTFKLMGQGDDADDRWYTLYHNGTCECIQAEIVWPDPKEIRWK